MFGSFCDVCEVNPQVFTRNGVPIELTKVSLAEDQNLKKFLEKLPVEKQAKLMYLLSWRRPSGFRS